MKRSIISLFAIGCLMAGSGHASAGEWIQLFDGKTLKGWGRLNGTATYRVEGGAIVGKTSEGSPNSFLCTEKEYGDFELEFEVKVDEELNSGVQVRSQTQDNPTRRVYGPQVEIEKSPGESGYIYGEATGRGWLTPEQELKPHNHMKNGDWNHFRVVAKGPRIQTWINGNKVADLTDEPIYKTHPKGFIGLQVHGVKAGTGPYEVAWKNIRLKPSN